MYKTAALRILSRLLVKNAALYKQADPVGKGINSDRYRQNGIDPASDTPLRRHYRTFAQNGVSERPAKVVYKSPEEASKYNNIEPLYYTAPGSMFEPGNQPYQQVIGYIPKSSVMGGSAINKNYNIDKVQQGQQAVIMIGGAMDPDRTHFTTMTMLPKDRYFSFRYEDLDQARQLAMDLAKKGAKVRLLGHSRGGGAVDEIGYAMQQAGYEPEIHLFDPVSRNLLFGRNTRLKSKGANVYVPSNPGWTSGDDKWSNFVASMGGRYSTKGAGVVRTYKGTHQDGLEYVAPFVSVGLEVPSKYYADIEPAEQTTAPQKTPSTIAKGH